MSKESIEALGQEALAAIEAWKIRAECAERRYKMDESEIVQLRLRVDDLEAENKRLFDKIMRGNG